MLNLQMPLGAKNINILFTIVQYFFRSNLFISTVLSVMAEPLTEPLKAFVISMVNVPIETVQPLVVL